MTENRIESTVASRFIFKDYASGVIEIPETYAEELLSAGIGKILNFGDQPFKPLDTKPRFYDKFRFYGIQIELVTFSLFKVIQKYYFINLFYFSAVNNFKAIRAYLILFSRQQHLFQNLVTGKWKILNGGENISLGKIKDPDWRKHRWYNRIETGAHFW